MEPIQNYNRSSEEEHEDEQDLRKEIDLLVNEAYLRSRLV
jgi:hypothetical protein